jgi:hypothetical protein
LLHGKKDGFVSRKMNDFHVLELFIAKILAMKKIRLPRADAVAAALLAKFVSHLQPPLYKLES